MENEVVKIIFIGLGVIIPISYGLFSRVLKDRDAKFDTLFSKHDKVNEKLEEMGKQLASIEADIKWIEKVKDGNESG